MPPFTVYIRGLEAYGNHGVPAEERSIGHRLSADITLLVEGNATQSDEVDDTVDYASVANDALEIMMGASTATLERIAHSICTAILARHAHAIQVEVMLEKPMPPMPFIADAAGVVVTLSRDQT